MDTREIESKARDLQQRIWAERASLWPDREPHPLDALDPLVAGRVLDIDFQYFEELKFDVNDNKYETAGLLNRPGRKIAIARRYGPEVMRFTGAHELGHWTLHPSSVTFHRDLPIKGLERKARDPREREADYFAACFLMPAKLVANVFRSMFRTNNPFEFDDTTAFHLRPNDTESLLTPDVDSYDREVALATARSFGGRHFEKSLAQLFQVSVATMAIRIRELKLVRVWP
ncbi:MAG: ImmA/IrrE family metallo-endopeptidase [Burkholderiales bacterium]